MAKRKPKPDPENPGGYACMFCGKPLELNAEAVMAHIVKNHGEIQTEAMRAMLRDLIAQLDDGITHWLNYPEGQVRFIAESDLAKSVMGEPRGGKLTDLLIIRLQCAEAFKRVAEEHAELIRVRQEMGG